MSKAPALAPTECEPTELMLRKQQRSGLQVPLGPVATPDMPSSQNTFRTGTRGPRATSAPSAGHRGPASVCKQTGHVAPAASSPPPEPEAPTETPRPILTRPCWAESAALREMGPEGPQDRCPVPGARRSRCQRAPCPRALGLRRAPDLLTRLQAAPSGPRQAWLHGDAPQQRTARPDPGLRALS